MHVHAANSSSRPHAAGQVGLGVHVEHLVARLVEGLEPAGGQSLAEPVPRAVRAPIGRRQPGWGYRDPCPLPHRTRCVLLATQCRRHRLLHLPQLGALESQQLLQRPDARLPLVGRLVRRLVRQAVGDRARVRLVDEHGAQAALTAGRWRRAAMHPHEVRRVAQECLRIARLLAHLELPANALPVALGHLRLTRPPELRSLVPLLRARRVPARQRRELGRKHAGRRAASRQLSPTRRQHVGAMKQLCVW